MVVLVLVLWVLSGFLLRALNSGEIIDGTRMGGVALGDKTRSQAAELIAEIKPQRVKLSGPRQTFTIPAPRAGLVIDVDGSVDRAYSSGRGGIAAILAGPLVLSGDRSLEPSFEPVDSERLTRTVDRIADQVDREPFDGALVIDRETLAVETERPVAGVKVRRGRTEEDLLGAFRAGLGSIELPVRRRPAPSPSEVDAVADEAETYLRSPLRIRTAGGGGDFSPRRIAAVLAIESTGSRCGHPARSRRGRRRIAHRGVRETTRSAGAGCRSRHTRAATGDPERTR